MSPIFMETFFLSSLCLATSKTHALLASLKEATILLNTISRKNLIHIMKNFKTS